MNQFQNLNHQTAFVLNGGGLGYLVGSSSIVPGTKDRQYREDAVVAVESHGCPDCAGDTNCGW